jgi:RNA polymerase sigma-70 factor (ECF subfamily)
MTLPAKTGPDAGSACAELEDFDALVRSYRPRIVRFLLGMVSDREAAEDLAQECFLRAHQAGAGFRGDAAVGTWLMRIAINLATDYHRSRRLQFWRAMVRPKANEELHDLTESVPDSHASPERSLVARQQADHVWRAAEKLSAQQRTVFLLRFVDEMEIAEIAETTGLAEGTVKVHLSRAVRSLRKQLQSA